MESFACDPCPLSGVREKLPLPSDLGSLKWAPVPLPPRLTFVSVDNAFVSTEPGMFSWPLRIRPWVPLNLASPTLARSAISHPSESQLTFCARLLILSSLLSPRAQVAPGTLAFRGRWA
jgi:hypothetical protein